LDAAPVSPRRTTMRGGDQVMLIGTLSSLLERVPTRSVRLVVFNLDQQKELYRQDDFHLDRLNQVGEAIRSLHFNLVDYRVLQTRNGHVALLADLVNQELRSETPSDVVLFLGPTTRFTDKVPGDSLERPQGAGPRFFYFEYKPFFRQAQAS